MQISFRQGLVKTPASFLQLSSNNVSLVIGPTQQVIATLADGFSNYLINLTASVNDAWIGPFTAGTDYWLYVDVDVLSGAQTFNHTIIQPTYGTRAPTVPAINQHWFDTSAGLMKVWNGFTWTRKIRVFVAELHQGSVFVSMGLDAPLFTGTQVGITSTIPLKVGNVVFDSNGYPLKRGDGKFFTTEDVALTGISTSTQVKLGSIIVEAEAVSPMSAYTIVQFTDFKKIDVAVNFVQDVGAYGMIESDVQPGDIVNVTVEGVVNNPDWDWTSVGIGMPLYVNGSGELTAFSPPTPIVVAHVLDVSTILFVTPTKAVPIRDDGAEWGNITGVLTNQDDLEAALAEKANAADVYTKTETDDLLDLKADVADTLAGYGITDGISTTTGVLPLHNGDITSAILVTSTTDPDQVLDYIPISIYKSAFYNIQITSSGDTQITTIHVTYKGTEPYLTEYGTVLTDGVLAVFDADVDAGTIRLMITPTNAATVIKFVRTTIQL